MLNIYRSKSGMRKHGPTATFMRLLLIFALVLTGMVPAFREPVHVHAAAPAVPPGWTHVWTDDFNGAANTPLNGANWLYDLGHSYPGGSANFGTGEIEEVTNSTANVYQDGTGNLVIKAIRDGAGNWTSGRIETQRSDFEPPAGGVLHVEASIQLPNVTGAAAQGYWPAFWMLGAPYRGNLWNWPTVGEIDIMENVQGINTVWGTLHCGTSPGGPCNEKDGISANRPMGTPSLQTAFHKYAIEWDKSVTPNQIRWYVDGIQYHQVNQSQVDAGTWNTAFEGHGFFIILNNAIGGEFPAKNGGGPYGTTASGGALKVDYVTVWSKTGGGGGGGVGAAIPGKVEAEFYSAMSGVQTEPTTDTGAGQDVGFIESGDWMDYNVNVATTGTYTVQYRVSAQTAPGSIQLRNGGTTLATTTVPVTGGWQNWTTVTATVNLNAGAQTLRLYAGTGGFNVNWINFSGGSTTTVATPTFNPAGGTYASPQTVTISTATSGAAIYYTTNGTAPNASSPVYTGPITVSATTAIQAIAMKSGMTNSAVASANFTIGTGGGGSGAEWTYGVDNVSSNQAKIWFKPTGFTAGYVILHYTRPGLPQQNLNMTYNGATARWEYTVTGITTGQALSYGYTYSKSGVQYDTPFYSWTKP